MTFNVFKKKYCCSSRSHNKSNTSTCPRKTSPLSEACHRGRVKICKVTGDRSHCARMAALGLYPGEEVELICPKQGGSQCLLKIHGSTLSLDHESMKNILIAAP
ncbi:MAG: ferrous iron transport protein A [Desulfobulbaceae bacterium]|uniref:Ferrous iron transport protein A n=1 Tax=Candidatus Desulfatifera sulfidica TaxID=2841691 RepID=A0A8J6TAE6_9BACT|nr:ferrous iron transport protein A [Candidatus Desulfatifera sulfidica]